MDPNSDLIASAFALGCAGGAVHCGTSGVVVPRTAAMHASPINRHYNAYACSYPSHLAHCSGNEGRAGYRSVCPLDEHAV
jgi:cobalamin biosynthesis protein CbiD